MTSRWSCLVKNCQQIKKFLVCEVIYNVVDEFNQSLLVNFIFNS